MTEHSFKLYAADTAFAGAVDASMLFEETAHDEGASIIPAFGNYVYVANKNLRFKTVASNSMFDGRKIHERWWFA